MKELESVRVVCLVAALDNALQELMQHQEYYNEDIKIIQELIDKADDIVKVLAENQNP